MGNGIGYPKIVVLGWKVFMVNQAVLNADPASDQSIPNILQSWLSQFFPFGIQFVE
jgi:hypothetical protein